MQWKNFETTYRTPSSANCGPTDMLISILVRTAEKWHSLPEQMHGALDEGDLKTCSSLAHNMKGLAGNISAVSIHDVAERLEKRTAMGSTTPDEGELEEIKDLLQELESLLIPFVSAVEKLHLPVEGRIGDPAPAELGPSDLNTLFSDLYNRVLDHDPEAEDIAGRLADVITSPDARAAYRKLTAQLQHYDFNGAVKTVRKLASEFDLQLEPRGGN